MTKQLNILVTNTATVPTFPLPLAEHLHLQPGFQPGRKNNITVSTNENLPWDHLEDHYFLVALVTSCISELKA